jgi:hypothetical protein
MEWFVQKDSIVRKIWGKGDTILFIFAGASAEFALNKAVDWLYFTGKLPTDPLGRLFSTVSYARVIVFAKKEAAFDAIDKMTAIHSAVEKSRGTTIPNWAYQDVLYMLIYYSIAAFELLERALTDTEKEEVFNVFYRVGMRMGIKGLPATYQEWLPLREEHLQTNLALSDYSINLYRQYKKNLGPVRFFLLKEGQKLVVPDRVKKLLEMGGLSLLVPILFFYKLSRTIRLDWLLKSAVLPAQYKPQIKDLDVVP